MFHVKQLLDIYRKRCVIIFCDTPFFYIKKSGTATYLARHTILSINLLFNFSQDFFNFEKFINFIKKENPVYAVIERSRNENKMFHVKQKKPLSKENKNPNSAVLIKLKI